MYILKCPKTSSISEQSPSHNKNYLCVSDVWTNSENIALPQSNTANPPLMCYEKLTIHLIKTLWKKLTQSKSTEIYRTKGNGRLDPPKSWLTELFPYFNGFVVTGRGNHPCNLRLCQGWYNTVMGRNCHTLVLSRVPKLQWLQKIEA